MVLTILSFFLPVLMWIRNAIFYFLSGLALSLFAFSTVFFVYYRVLPTSAYLVRLRSLAIPWVPYDLFRWLLCDFITRRERAEVFSEYGFTLFVGRQGAGKTISMVEYLEEMRQKYPRVKIVTNFKYLNADYLMQEWRDLFEIRNGTDGVIFAIDEIQGEYSSDKWKDFPEQLLSEISQQRKQRIKIVSTAQAFSRVAKPIREQTSNVRMCRTYLNRYTRWTEYDAATFGTGDTPYIVKKRCVPSGRKGFVQSDGLRSLYDTWEKVERMKRLEFIPRAQR
ncbi:zonular occludens toxin domain-containing protein [Oscillospiraceae bacterium LTW-04]|nr:hypothetical protein RBH76_02370 [Oscillospiraceae bacterium MB24-C1]